MVSLKEPDQATREEFHNGYGATVVFGDITREYFLRQLRVSRARKILLLSDNSLRSYEAASTLIVALSCRYPNVG